MLGSDTLQIHSPHMKPWYRLRELIILDLCPQVPVGVNDWEAPSGGKEGSEVRAFVCLWNHLVQTVSCNQRSLLL